MGLYRGASANYLSFESGCAKHPLTERGDKVDDIIGEGAKATTKKTR